jgi:hypothetical protein
LPAFLLDEPNLRTDLPRRGSAPRAGFAGAASFIIADGVGKAPGPAVATALAVTPKPACVGQGKRRSAQFRTAPTVVPPWIFDESPA